MTSSDILVKHFHINVPVYIGNLEKRRKDNLLDEELCCDVVRLYFLDKLKRVIIRTKKRNGRENTAYFYEIANGDIIQYKPHELSLEIIERIMNDKRGGTRRGAGRNPIAGTGSVTVRVPLHLKNEIMSIIDIYAQLSSNNKDVLQPMGRTTETERKKALEWLDMVSKYEHYRVDKLKEQKRMDEENRRQLKLFPEGLN